jgi:propionyl-CoA carboxylase alpha chain
MWRRFPLLQRPRMLIGHATLKIPSLSAARPFQKSLGMLSVSHEKFFSTATTSDPPFSKVLIANRGEIAQRIMKTCKSLGIETVAIYSTADAQAPFVQAADQAICIGPAASAESYLNVPRVLQAIRDTNAQAVHPGYGFLSENAEFCQAIQGEGVAWLGPSVSAMYDMGDKIRSKLIADKAGVRIIPGYEGTIESVEHALEVSNSIGYPILVKAAAGGGGKGMRTCYHDQDVKEAYPMAKSEAKSFFSDDRLLIEKYIINPHHIEFQVLCSLPAGSTTLESPEDLQVVVFPERECSIQRRNQKVVEESPSCLLTEETRQQMVEQVKKLCQKVGYVSAGTVEFLVDENQSFYFLEMNTRLQVEHPVTESITGVDLVKGMLWIGAGRGFPEEFQIEGTLMPHKGHAIEARIYAEDPRRGFLPSTGPLIPYVEPIAVGKGESYLRLDSGVAQGHVVTPFYDPMLAKIISYAPTRAEAIEALATGLDNYIIEGVQHNARLVNAVLRHPSFQEGKTPTSFLTKHFPDFSGVELTDSQQEELAVAAALIGLARQTYMERPPISMDGSTLVVRLGGMFDSSAYRVTLGLGEAQVQRLSTDPSDNDGVERTISFDPIDYEPSRYLAHVSLDGILRSLQVSECQTIRFTTMDAFD